MDPNEQSVNKRIIKLDQSKKNEKVYKIGVPEDSRMMIKSKAPGHRITQGVMVVQGACKIMFNLQLPHLKNTTFVAGFIYEIIISSQSSMSQMLLSLLK
jgi:hypothetical protein